jgi:16S rRNA (cytosine967-C5)-methyltransferase
MGRADVVLVDAPCSGTGVFRRNPDTSWTLARADVERMVQQQRAILDEHAPLVRPGGRLVYATCSILRDENERAVAELCARQPQLRVVEAGAALAGRVDVARLALSGAHLAVDPAHHGTDGFFAAVFERVA